MQGRVLGQIGKGSGSSSGNCTIKFNIEPKEATLVIKDNEGIIVDPSSQLTYELSCGKYSYELSIGSVKRIEDLSIVEDKTIDLRIADFGTVSDSDLTSLLESHYNGTTDLSNLFNIGDIRYFHLEAMASKTDICRDSHIAQDMPMRIIGINHDDLQDQTGIRKKALLTLDCANTLGSYGSSETGYYIYSSKISASSNWSKETRRTWCNDIFFNALPTTIGPSVKTVIKRSLSAGYYLMSDNKSVPSINTEDKAFLLSVTEITKDDFKAINDDRQTYYCDEEKEGYQYPYYAQARVNWVKHANDVKGSMGSRSSYATRSPGAYYWESSDRYFICIASNEQYYTNRTGPSESYGQYNTSFAPAFCL